MSDVKTQEPDVSETKPKRKLRLKQNRPDPMIKNVWLAGHGATLAFGTIYACYYFLRKSHHSKIAWLAYRLCLSGVVSSYIMALLSQFNKKSIPGYYALLGTSNFQYLCLAMFWIINRSSFFKILPYLVISTLQLSSFFHVKPILAFETRLKLIIVYDELYILGLLLLDTLLMRGNSGYGLLIYFMFYWLRVIQNEDVRKLVYSIIIKLDPIIQKQAANKPKVGSAWERAKHFLSSSQEELDKIFH